MASKITTADCKSFIANFVAKNPSVILSIFGPSMPTVERTLLIDEATNTKNWKRLNKFKITEDEHDDFDVYNINVPVKRSGYDGTVNVDAKHFTIGREFCLLPSKYESSIMFTILEKPDGSLVFGPYSGD